MYYYVANNKPRLTCPWHSLGAGHSSLATTQRYMRYIQGDTAAKRNVIKLI
jgi:hypothetical protein